MTAQNQLHRIAAFTTDANGGNPAGVWIGDTLPDATTMQRIAAEVGYSETAFIAPAQGFERTVRYYSPLAEVSFCGHATIASGVVLGETSGEGTYRLATAIGEVPVLVQKQDHRLQAALTSVTPRQEEASESLVSQALKLLGKHPNGLDQKIPPIKAYAGAWHLVLAFANQQSLQTLEYDFEQLKQLMLEHGLTTLQLIWRESDHVFHVRNPFPVGGVKEDPATGAAAAALGGYLRDAGLVAVPATLAIYQGYEMGRPSQIQVDVPEQGGIVVSGAAVKIEA